MGTQQMPAPNLLGRRHAVAIRFAAALARATLTASDMLHLWMDRYRQRRALGKMSDHLLKDLGLSRSDAGREVGKRFWEG